MPARRIGVAASAAVGPRLGGGAGGAVLLSGRFAAYLAVADDVLAVVASDAVAPPASVVLPPGTRPHDVLSHGDTVLAHGGDLLVRPHSTDPVLLHPTRWWEPAQVRAGAPDAGAVRALTAALAALPAPPHDVALARAAGDRAAAALVAGAVEEAATELYDVLGLGPGTTPSGDDVAAGVLLAARALLPGPHRAGVDRLGVAVVAAAATRTGCVSRSMLGQAALGRAPAVVVRAVDALTGHGDAAARVEALLSLGHHSGADIACGALAVAGARGGQP